MRAHRPKHRDLSPLAKKKANARAYANTYLRRGHIKKTGCVMCGDPDSQMHHKNYDDPLDVVWVCRECHLKLHQKHDRAKSA